MFLCASYGIRNSEHGSYFIDLNCEYVVNILQQQPIRQNTFASTGQKRSADDVQAAESYVNNAQKKIKTKTSINITNHTPLNDISGWRRVNIPASPAHDQPTCNSSVPSSLPSDPPCVPNFEYPAVSDVLEELHRTFPAFNLPQYSLAFSNHGIATVDDARYMSKDLLIAIGIPTTILDVFYDHAARMALGAEGGAVSQPRY